MTWQWYQNRIAEFFRLVQGAKVNEDVKVMGKSGSERQIDVQVFLPMKVELGKDFRVQIEIHIIVDAKKHERPVDINLVGQINDLRDDVGAHAAIIASPKGFTEGARNRCNEVPVFPMTLTSDLLQMLNEVEVPWDFECLNELCPQFRGRVAWRTYTLESKAVLGACDYCNEPHILCPDCGDAFCVPEYELGEALKCPGCEKIYRLTMDHRSGDYEIEVWDELDQLLVGEAYKNNPKRLAKGMVEKLISRTKWQHFGPNSPTASLTESGRMEWDDSGEYLSLTPTGEDEYETAISDAKEPGA